MKDRMKNWEGIIPPYEPWEIIPHVIPIEIKITDYRITRYTFSIPLQEYPFLVNKIRTLRPVRRIVLKLDGRIYYSAPGWLHYDTRDGELSPAIRILSAQAGWTVEIEFEIFDDMVYVCPMEIALIGEKAQPIY